MPPAHRAGNSGGVHFLAAPRVARKLAQSCQAGPADLVLDLGAGQGAITSPLAATGARVLAVERDPEFVRLLRRRFDDRENVRIVAADLRTFALPRKEFVVAASIPYALSTVLFRRLLGPDRTSLRRAAVIVEWGFAKRVTAAAPSRFEQAWWSVRFDIRLISRISARCFSPRPRVDSAHVVIERTDLGRPLKSTLWTLLDMAYRDPTRPVRTVASTALAGRNPHPVLRAAGIDPARPAGTIAPKEWRELAKNLRR